MSIEVPELIFPFKTVSPRVFFIIRLIFVSLSGMFLILKNLPAGLGNKIISL